MENQETEAQLAESCAKLRDAIVQVALDNDLSFDVVLNALSQTAAVFLFDLLLLANGEITEDGVNQMVEKFNEQNIAVAEEGLRNMRAYMADMAEQQAKNSQV
jgi:hypothetical protein